MDKVVLYFGPLDALSAVLVSQKASMSYDA